MQRRRTSGTRAPRTARSSTSDSSRLMSTRRRALGPVPLAHCSILAHTRVAPAGELAGAAHACCWQVCVGDQIRFGQSSRIHILCGPPELLPEEGLSKARVLPRCLGPPTIFHWQVLLPRELNPCCNANPYCANPCCWGWQRRWTVLRWHTLRQAERAQLRQLEAMAAAQEEAAVREMQTAKAMFQQRESAGAGWGQDLSEAEDYAERARAPLAPRPISVSLITPEVPSPCHGRRRCYPASATAAAPVHACFAWC